MNPVTELRFFSNEGDVNEGLGDAGIETFKDAIYAGIARETGQNSADAWASKPVRMSFDVLEIEREDLPGLSKLNNTVNICLKQSMEEKDEKAIDFFNRAKTVLAEPKIKLLKVADYNTKGLTGPSKRGTPFHSLVKGSGISTKESDTSGGSFGIGKNAAFAVSELQTVFYTSQYKSSNGQLNFIAQGKTILVSHIDENGTNRRSLGFWGLPDLEAITDIDLVPKWLQRKEQGTSIFCAGFRFQTGWQYMIAASLLANFFNAIHSSEMEFEINNGEIKLNKNTLAKYFEKDEMRVAAEKNNNLEGFEFAKSLFSCITSAYTKERIFENDALGKVSFKILVAEDLPKKLAIIRNGMVITDNLEHFGDKFAKFPMAKEFVALLEPMERAGNALIKKLENPRHDGLSAERINDPSKRKEAYSAIKDLIKMIRNAIREETTSVPDKEVTIDELSEFFADDTRREKSNDPDHENNLDTFVYEISQKQQRQQPAASTSNLGGVNISGGNRSPKGKVIGDGEGGVIGGDRTGDNEGPNEDSAQLEGQENKTGRKDQLFKLNIRDIRNMFVYENGKKYRRIFFTSPSTCQAQITIQATGINDVADLEITSAHRGIIEKNKLLIEVIEGNRCSIDIETAEDYQGPIEIIAHRVGGSNEN